MRLWGLALFIASALLIVTLTTENPFGEMISGKKKALATAKKGSSDEAPPPPPPLSDDEAAALEEAEANLPRVAKTKKELAVELDELCEQMNKELEVSEIVPAFAKIDLKFHERRLKESVFKDLLANCFKKKADAKNRVELDVFSADFTGEKAADLVQVQVSVFDRESKNKIFESGIHFEISSIQRDGPAISEGRVPNSSREPDSVSEAPVEKDENSESEVDNSSAHSESVDEEIEAAGTK